MLRKLLVIGVAMALSMGTAYAHDYTITYTHLLKVVAPATAQGKTVVKATANVGVLAMQQFLPGYPKPSYPVKPYWAAKKTIELAKTGQHFFGKHKLNVTEMPPGPRMGPVMVELNLTFADGETLTVRAEAAKVGAQHNTSTYDAYNSALAEELAKYNKTTDAKETSVATISVYRRGPVLY